MIVKVKGGYQIRSHKTGKLYPKVYSSSGDAQNRIDQMEKFKHFNKSVSFVILEKAKGFRLARGQKGEEEKSRAKKEKKAEGYSPHIERLVERSRERNQ